jgi:hypothetical protein
MPQIACGAAIRNCRVEGRPQLPMSGCGVGENTGMVDQDEFERIRAEVCVSGPASEGDNLLGMEIDACAFLGDPAYADDDPGLWHDMTVRRSEGAEWLISGRATGKAEDAASIGAELSRIWEQRLRYDYRSAHTVIWAPDSVTLRAVTQMDPGHIWVTADIQVALS